MGNFCPLTICLFHFYCSQTETKYLTVISLNLDSTHFVIAELIWRCILRKQFDKLLSVLLGCMSVAILLAEATLLPSGVDLSLFSILIKSAGRQEVLVQVYAGNDL